VENFCNQIARMPLTNSQQSMGETSMERDGRVERSLE
jgi:hypothetical protein